MVAQASWDRTHPPRVPAAAELDHRRREPLVSQDEIQPEAVHADLAARGQERLDVVEVVGVAGMGDLHLGRLDPLLREHAPRGIPLMTNEERIDLVDDP